MITSFIFHNNTLSIYSKDINNRAILAKKVQQTDLPPDIQIYWVYIISAINSFLLSNELVGDIVVELMGKLPIIFDVDQTPLTYRTVLTCNITILCSDGAMRQVWLSTEDFTSTAVRDALLTLFQYIEDNY